MAMPQFQFPANALLDFSGLNAGIDAVGKKWKDDEKKQNYYNALAGAGGIVDPRLMALAQGMEPDQGTNALFGAYGQAENRKMTQAQMAETRRMHDQTLALQQQAENRNAAMLPYQIASAKAGSESAGIDTQLKQRELLTPKDNLQKLKDDERLVKVDPRTGASTEVVSPSNDSGYKSLGERVTKEHDLRKEYTAQAKPFIEVRDAFRRVETAARNPSAAGDMSLIFNFMKILDPGSVVREGEFATAQNATGVPDRILNAYNKVVSGERLNPAQRADFVNQSRQLYQTQSEQHQKLRNEFADIARGAKLDPKRVGIDLDTAAAATQPPPNPTPAGAPQIGYDARSKTFNVMNPQTGEWQPIRGARSVQEAEKAAATMPQGAATAQVQAAPVVRVNSPQEAASLPSGTRFVTHDGREMVKN